MEGSMFVFGSGVLLGQRTDIANATPVNFGLVQEVQLDLSFDLKQLYGQYQFPVALGRGKGKLSGKAKMARISGLAFSSLFFGQAVSTGELLTAFGEAHSVPSSSSYTVTVTNAATYVDDYGVVYAATGLPLTRVTTVSAAGQYSVNTATGVYTFYSGDASAAVLLSYTYTVTTAGTQQLTVSNQLMGVTPTFQAQLYTSFQGLPLNAKLYNCVSAKLGLATKLDDFMVPELDFDIFANAAGNVMNLSFGEAS
jgi:uncharacterized protein YaiE (UPF0345 family)